MPKSRVLVIDDEAAIRDSLRMTLEYEGYEFVGAATGQEGLALAERESPDLVLLDVKMPGMDGLEVRERSGAREPAQRARSAPAAGREPLPQAGRRSPSPDDRRQSGAPAGDGRGRPC